MFVKLRFAFIFVLSMPVFSQVGIGTTSPTASLDINGDLRIRFVEEETNPLTKDLVAKDSVLVISNEIVKSIPSKGIIESVLLTAVKGGFSNATSSAINLGSTYTHILFDNESFDLNDEFDTSTGIFTAKQDGIYQVKVQISAGSTISASTNYGVCILKNSILEARENFANINVNVEFPEMNLGLITIPGTTLLNLPVTPPIRKTETLLQLTTGDEVSFQVYSDLGATVNLSDNIVDSFFTIVQIR